MADAAAMPDVNDNNDSVEASDGSSPPSVAELPFLVTHWLANYQRQQQHQEEGDQQSDKAIERLRNATSEMAAAFSALGAYGTTSRVSAVSYIQSVLTFLLCE